MFKISINFDEKYFTPETYHKIAVIEECMGAVNEGVVTNDVITMTLSYTHSLALEMLENIKEALLKLCSLVLSALNNYILNNAKYIERYKEILKVRIAKLDKPFFLAGGINSGNLDDAIKINAYAIDVSSGVETNGIKDPNKIKEIVRRIKNDSR